MQEVPCDAFQKNSDGSWTTVKPVTISSPMGEVKLNIGQTFRKGVQFMGLDLASLLDENCS